jgi:simple sugar transport system permease protein
VKRLKKILLAAVGPTVALILSLIVGGVLIFAIGRDPLQVYGQFLDQTLGNWYGIGQVLFKATPLIFTGLSAAIGFRAGLFNIGAEGQLTIGAFLTAVVGFTFHWLPALLLIPLCLAAGIAGGAVWGFVPGILKARFGAHEVINTIMMNFIASALVSYLVSNVFLVPATVHTPQIPSSASLPRLDSILEALRGAPVNAALLLAVLTAVLMYYFLSRTRSGYELRTVGSNPHAGEYGGMNVRKKIVMTMTMAGGIAGLAGCNFVMGYKHYFELGFSEGAGFIGIAVALLARNNPIGVIFTSIFFGILEYGSLTINTLVPKELANILQAIVIIFIIVISRLTNNWVVEFQRRSVLANDHV